ncbi:OppA family ABC transporter substrate-binding lipoprotein [Mycoplasma sp. 4463]|uniref:OppA family ABC transporter substrate-binding lipoprotein n=1 Tax=Mycoplasma sp. 4463 TaxID=3400998 RepID=UPI003AACA203
MKKYKKLLLGAISGLSIISPLVIASCSNTGDKPKKPPLSSEERANYQRLSVQETNLANEAWAKYQEYYAKKEALYEQLHDTETEYRAAKNENTNSFRKLVSLQSEKSFYILVSGSNDLSALILAVDNLPKNNDVNLEVLDRLGSYTNKSYKVVLEEDSTPKSEQYNATLSNIEKLKQELENQNINLDINKKSFAEKTAEYKKLEDKNSEEAQKFKSAISQLEQNIQDLNEQIADIKSKQEIAKHTLDKLTQLINEDVLMGSSFAEQRQQKLNELTEQVKSAEVEYSKTNEKFNAADNAYRAKLVEIENQFNSQYAEQMKVELEKFNLHNKLARNYQAQLIEDDLASYGQDYVDQNAGKNNFLTSEQVKNILYPNIEFNKSKVSDRFAQKQIYQEVYNSVYSSSTYPWDVSAGYGNPVDPLLWTTYSSLISLESSGKAKFINTEKSALSEDGITNKKTELILQPTLQRFKLDLADAIILYVQKEENGTKLTDPNGKPILEAIVFDQDDAGLVPGPTEHNDVLNVDYYTTSIVKRTSSNPRSINSANFFEKVGLAHRMEFRIRNGVFWVDSNGNKTQYPVVADDFYISILRTKMNDTLFRRQNGGSKTADDDIRSMLSEPNKLFDDRQQYTNSYLFDLFNVSLDKILDRSNSVVNKDGHSYFGLERLNENAAASFVNILDMITKSYEFAAAPSEFIKDKNRRNDQDITPQTKEDQSNEVKINKIRQSVQSIDGLAKDSGIYWYGFSQDKTLFAGKYYGSKFNSDTLTQSTFKNMHYWDSEFVNNPTTINQFSSRFQNYLVDAAIFDDSSYNQYLFGQKASYSFTGLTQKRRDAVLQDPNDYGLNSVKLSNKGSLTKHFIWSLLPKEGSSTTYFNDAYSYVMWNMSTSEAISQSSKNAIKSVSVGTGAEFKTILSAAIDWNTIGMMQRKPQPAVGWVSYLAPDNDINSNALDNSTTNSLRSNSDIVNAFFVVDSQTGQRVDFGAIGNLINPSDTQNINTTADDSVKSVVYEQLKARMKDLLDRVYGQNPTLLGKTVDISIFYRFFNYPTLAINALDLLIKAWNGLDPRLNIKLIKPIDKDEWRGFWTTTPSPVDLIGWGYDYNGIGSGITGVAQRAHITTAMLAILADPEYAQKMQALYPQLYKAAQRLGEFIKIDGNKLSITPEQVTFNLTNSQVQHLSNIMGMYKWDGEKLIRMDESDNLSSYTSWDNLNANFWLDYTQNPDPVTGEMVSKLDLVHLAQEIGNFVGAVPSAFSYMSTSILAKTLKNPNYLVPEFETEIPYWVDIRTVNGK